MNFLKLISSKQENWLPLEAIRLQKLAEALLQVNKIDSGKFTINVQDDVDILTLISETIKDIEKKYNNDPLLLWNRSFKKIVHESSYLSGSSRYDYNNNLIL